MDTKNKYFTYLIKGIILLAIYIALGTVIYILQQYNSVYRDLFNSLESIVRLGRTFTMLGLLAILAYLIYKGYLYLSSKFFLKTRISIIDAFINGFIDIAFVYDKLVSVKSIDSIIVDLKNRALIVSTKNVNYSIMIRDYSGKIQGGINYENWYVISKKRKEYNLITYKKKVPINNPHNENVKLISELELREGKEYQNLVLITNLKKPDVKSNQIVQLYALLEIISKEITF